MQLRDYQSQTYKILLYHNNCMLFWPRQRGKTYLLTHYIENFVQNNYDQEIVFFGNNHRNNNDCRDKILRDIMPVIDPKRIRKAELGFINENYLTFESIEDRKYEMTLNKLKPTLIIYDEIMLGNTYVLAELRNYIERNNVKCIFTSTFMNLDIIKFLDYKNTFYINIFPIQPEDEFEFSKGVSKYSTLLEKLSYKPKKLLDYMDNTFQRKIKLQRLKEISEENGE
jgi:hypothetical protein